MGTITGISDLDPVRWKNSQWRNLQVELVPFFLVIRNSSLFPCTSVDDHCNYSTLLNRLVGMSQLLGNGGTVSQSGRLNQ